MPRELHPLPRRIPVMVRTALVLCAGLLATPGAASTDVATSAPATAAWQDDLSPLPADAWDASAAAHLLERAGFGGTPEEIAATAALGPEVAVRQLVRWQSQPNVSLPAFPTSDIFPSDDFYPPPDGDFGPIVIRSVITRSGLGVDLGWNFEGRWLQPIFDQFFYLIFADSLETTRLASWQGDRMLRTQRPLEEKLALFWHGHFATEAEKVRDHRKMRAQWDLFRAEGNGSFRTLLLGVARDPAMLIYLDGKENVRGDPNENFAREILELFTLGPGNYSEQDIKEAARAFTGWGLDGNEFDSSWWQHDKREKTVLGQTGRFDGEDVIDVILEQPAAANFLVAKLYRHFVRPDLSPAVEARLAGMLRENDYEIAPVLEVMFRSKDFYSPATRGAHIKAPVELVVSTYRRLGLAEMPGIPVFGFATKELGQGLFEPPNVAGWQGDTTWINPSTLTGRQNFMRQVLFPQEIPPLDRSLHEIVVTGALGEPVYQALKRMELEGRRGEPIEIAAGEPGMGRQIVDDEGLFDLPWAIWNGAEKAIANVRFDGLGVARLDIAGLVRASGAVDAAGATDVLIERFVAVPVSPEARALLTARLRERMGTSQIDWERPQTEADLRELLHLVLSLPEYQVS